MLCYVMLELHVPKGQAYYHDHDYDDNVNDDDYMITVYYYYCF